MSRRIDLKAIKLKAINLKEINLKILLREFEKDNVSVAKAYLIPYLLQYRNHQWLAASGGKLPKNVPKCKHKCSWTSDSI